MKSIVCTLTAVLAATICLGVARASVPIAVYALVDTVSFEPSADKPERIRVSGVFITIEDGTGASVGPQRGYLYFALPVHDAELARREWADLKSVAGTRQVVGFGAVWFGKIRLRKPDEEARSPDQYLMGNGLVKIYAEHPRAKALLDYGHR